MILTFHGKPLASRQDLCDIDRLLRDSHKDFKKLEVLARRKQTDFLSNGKTRIIGLISPYQDFPFFTDFTILYRYYIDYDIVLGP